MHADAETQATIFVHPVHGLGQLLLRGQRRGHRAVGRVEDGQHRIAGHVDHAPRRDRWDAEHLARGVQRATVPPVVQRHQPREAAGVGRQDGGQG